MFELSSRLNREPKSDSASVSERPANTPMLGMQIHQPGLKLASAPGFYGDSSKLLTYQPFLVRSLLNPFLDADLTVCSSAASWLKHCIPVLYAVFLMLTLAFTAFPDGEMGQQACDEDVWSRNVDMCELDIVLTDAKKDFQVQMQNIRSPLPPHTPNPAIAYSLTLLPPSS
jgi:hypothetical protein